MTLGIRVHGGVESDLIELFTYLQEVAPEQVDLLLDMFLETVSKTIPQMPNAYAPLFKHYRHIYLRPFKYYIAYQVGEETIDILAVRHGSEHPEKTQAKLNKRVFK